MIIQDIMKIRFNPKDAQFEFKTPLERTTFEKYYPIPPNTQMERQRPVVKLSYIKLQQGMLLQPIYHSSIAN